MRLAGGIDITPGGTTGDPRNSFFRIDGHVAHAAQIDHDTVITDRVAGDIMPAASNRDRVIVASGKGQSIGDILRASALRDQRGFAINHGIPDRPGFFIALVARKQYVTTNLQGMFLYGVIHVRLLVLCY